MARRTITGRRLGVLAARTVGTSIALLAATAATAHATGADEPPPENPEGIAAAGGEDVPGTDGQAEDAPETAEAETSDAKTADHHREQAGHDEAAHEESGSEKAPHDAGPDDADDADDESQPHASEESREAPPQHAETHDQEAEAEQDRGSAAQEPHEASDPRHEEPGEDATLLDEAHHADAREAATEDSREAQPTRERSRASAAPVDGPTDEAVSSAGVEGAGSDPGVVPREPGAVVPRVAEPTPVDPATLRSSDSPLEPGASGTASIGSPTVSVEAGSAGPVDSVGSVSSNAARSLPTPDPSTASDPTVSSAQTAGSFAGPRTASAPVDAVLSGAGPALGAPALSADAVPTRVAPAPQPIPSATDAASRGVVGVLLRTSTPAGPNGQDTRTGAEPPRIPTPPPSRRLPETPSWWTALFQPASTDTPVDHRTETPGAQRDRGRPENRTPTAAATRERDDEKGPSARTAKTPPRPRPQPPAPPLRALAELIARTSGPDRGHADDERTPRPAPQRPNGNATTARPTTARPTPPRLTTTRVTIERAVIARPATKRATPGRPAAPATPIRPTSPPLATRRNPLPVRRLPALGRGTTPPSLASPPPASSPTTGDVPARDSQAPGRPTAATPRADDPRRPDTPSAGQTPPSPTPLRPGAQTTETSPPIDTPRTGTPAPASRPVRETPARRIPGLTRPAPATPSAPRSPSRGDDVTGLVPAPLPPRTYTPVPSIGTIDEADRGPRTTRPSRGPAPRARDWPSGVVRDGSDAERERGRPADVLVLPVDGSSWSTITAVSGLTTMRGTSARIVLDTPLLPSTGATLQACAAGDYRAHWTAFAGRLSGLKTAPIVDLGAGMNRAGTPWSGDPGAYAQCWSEVARTVKAAAPTVAFQWTPVLGSQPGMPGDSVLAAWPEQRLVDVVGVDATADGRPWSEQVNGAYGLNYWAAFADRHGRRIAVARWGVRAGVSDARTVNPAYIRNVHDWVARVAAKQALAYEAYSEPADAPKTIADAYRDLF